MGKKGGSSWFTAVKKAFRSPTKGSDGKSCKKRDEIEQEEQDKKKEKPRWIFRKATIDHHTQHQNDQNMIDRTNRDPIAATADHTQALAVAAATVAAAEAAAATAQAAAKIARFTRRSSFITERHFSAVIIQTAFRGYLARRALRALKGIVKLQAFIRGQITRKQSRETLRCMEALIRVQSQISDQQVRLSQERSRKSMFAESTNLWDRYMQDVRQRKSTSAKERSTADQWGGFPCIFEEDEAMLQGRKDAAPKSERTLAYALSQQIRRSGSARALRAEEDINERTDWLNQWMEKKQWEEYTNRGSTDRRDSIKTVQMDISVKPQPCSNGYVNDQRREKSPQAVGPILSQSRRSLSHPTPSPPSSCHTKPLQVRSASPRSVREGRSHSTANTPSLKSKYTYNRGSSSCGQAATTPNYMATTASAKAKVRSASTPKQRPSTPSRERSGSVRKRLSYPIHEYGSVCTDNSSFSHSLRSPSFRSVCPAVLERGNYQSYYADSACGEASPASTTQIRRWLN